MGSMLGLLQKECREMYVGYGIVYVGEGVLKRLLSWSGYV